MHGKDILATVPRVGSVAAGFGGFVRRRKRASIAVAVAAAAVCTPADRRRRAGLPERGRPRTRCAAALAVPGAPFCKEALPPLTTGPPGLSQPSRFTRVVSFEAALLLCPQAGAGQRQHNNTKEDRPMTTATMATGTRTTETAAAETELRAAARRRGLTMQELAARMGVSTGYLSQISTGRRPWTPKMREKAAAVLGEVPGQGIVYRQGGVVSGESSYIRERARALGMTMRDLADRVGVSYGYMTQVARGHGNMGVKVQARIESALGAPVKIAPAQRAGLLALGEASGQGIVYRQRGLGESSYIRESAREQGMSMRDLADRAGVSYGYMTQVSRGHRNMGVKVQARVESALEAPAKVAPAKCAVVDRQAVWGRMNTHGISQNEVARRAGLSSAYLSQIMSGKSTPSPGVLKRLHGVLFQRTKAEERVVPAEVKVMAWKKGERSGMVVRGAGGPGRGGKIGGGTVRIGGRVPWGAEVEYAYRAGYDSRGRVSVTHVVDERGYSAMLKQPEPAAA